MFNLRRCIAIVYFIIFSNSAFNASKTEDLYSSITVLEEVYKTEKLYIENTENFLNYSSKLLIALKSKFNELRLKNKKNPERYNLFSKNLKYQFWMNTFEYFSDYHKNVSNIFQKEYSFPNDADLEGVTRAISRLQNVYNYSAKDIATGKFIKSENNKARLLSSDCFEIAYKLFSIKFEKAAEEWFELAYELYDNDDEKYLLTDVRHISSILDFKAHYKYRLGGIKNYQEAVELIERAISIKKDYDQHLQNQLNSYKKFLDDALSDDINNFNSLCRGEFQRNPKELKSLYCTYKYGKHPFLKIAPLKQEILNTELTVAVFHDVIYDTEIEILKGLSNSSLSRAQVWNPYEAKVMASDVRTSKLIWLGEDVHPVINIINQRLEDMTDMDMDCTEELQVMNYGIGGHYSQHFDFFPEPTKNGSVGEYSMFPWGNRIATVLFYLSDVEQGGGTAYPRHGTIVLPKKGDAAFWFNMLPQGKGDLKSRHGACPVVFGSKWVANKWIRSNCQIFKKLCPKNRDANFSVLSA